MARGITYKQVRSHRLKCEIESINDTLSKHFTDTDEPIDITVTDVNKQEILEEFQKGWDISYEYADYVNDTSVYRFAPKYDDDDSDNY